MGQRVTIPLFSKLKNELVITGEHANDYVQFTIRGLSWQSKSPKRGASCDVGGLGSKRWTGMLREAGIGEKQYGLLLSLRYEYLK